jgi:ankyrin repeat protein
MKNGADPNQKHQLGWTALHVAAVNGNVDVVKVLLKVLVIFPLVNLIFIL